jgi:hypothetical protein
MTPLLHYLKETQSNSTLPTKKAIEWAAAFHGKVGTLMFLIKHDVKPEKNEEMCKLALLSTMKHNRKSIAEGLIEDGVSIRTSLKDTKTATQLSAQRGSDMTVEWLLL